MDYQTLAAQALGAAVRTRSRLGLDLTSPANIYDLCEDLDIIVKFVDINMEGVYVREPRPRIIISALRPLVRRNFTCAHELGHHVFGHGSNLDLLAADAAKKTPEEFLVDSFAGFFLMPTLGIRKAFAARGWKIRTASPDQVFTVACSFGVGYSTLVNYLSYAVREIGRVRATQLLKTTPQQIKEHLLDTITPGPLVIVDKHWGSSTIDVEVGSLVLLPSGALPSSDSLIPMPESPRTDVFLARCPGIVRVSEPNSGWAKFARIMPEGFVGLAKYRHLEGDDE